MTILDKIKNFYQDKFKKKEVKEPEEYMSRSRLYSKYKSMKKLCYTIDSSHPSYHSYKGKGIKVCDEWLNDFNKFKQWAISHGFNEHTKEIQYIYRKDIDKDFCPSNCFVTNKYTFQPNKIRRGYREYTFNGETLTVIDWAKKLSIPLEVFERNLKKHDIKEAIEKSKGFEKNINIIAGCKNRLYAYWLQMKRNCYIEKYPSYHLYGGKGIKVCDEWQTFEGFTKWAITQGYDETGKSNPKITVVRKDTTKNYTPDNCILVMKPDIDNSIINKITDFINKK